MDDVFKLYCGNSFELLKKFDDETFDMIFVDPPYLISNVGTSCQNGKLVSINKGGWDKCNGVEENFEFHKKWLAECKRLLKPNATIWVSGTYHSLHPCGFAMQLLGYHILNDIIWFKPNASPNLSCKYFAASHESLVWARKNKKAKHYFDYQAMKEGDFPKDMIKKPHCQMRTVWSINATPPQEKIFGRHPTQKPLALLERIVKASTPEGALILDPFMGSGTTGVAATKLNRRFIGIDNCQEYVNLAEKRIIDAINNKPIL
ncbi:MAG: site-specific DNA-methyltransferase [Alphaproteobacteria bacterium]|nr:site-specific DNA-methyltransferase [Alphaproteobacteria bacterium]